MVTDYTTSVGSLAYSNIDLANMHQSLNTIPKNGITSQLYTSNNMLESTVQRYHRTTMLIGVSTLLVAMQTLVKLILA